MSAPDLRIRARSRAGELRLDGSFAVIHKELTEDGNIGLVCRDQGGACVSLLIRAKVLEDVEVAQQVDASRADKAEAALLERLAR
jgi:hypothetical protein